jgi:hypothetical protein
LVAGLMVVACAVGVRRALAAGRGATWGPRLLGLYGLGLVGAGAFVADPMNGFPPGTAAGRPEFISLHGMLHIAAAAIGFLCLVAACFVLARRFASEGRRSWSVFSSAVGVVFLAAFVGVASGSESPVVILAFWVAVLMVWGWIAALAVHLYRQLSPAARSAG